MNERAAIAIVEQKYGTLEEFAVFCLTEAPKVLDAGVSPAEKAKLVDLDMATLDFLATKSPKFRVLMRSALANGLFGLAQEAEHVKQVIRIATNQGRTVVTNKGDIVTVDNQEKAVIDAGRYLNEYRGTPLDSSQKATSIGVNVVFGVNPGPQSGQEADYAAQGALPGREADHPSRTITIAGHQVRPHSPLRPGSLPPEGSRARYGGLPHGDGTVRPAGGVGSDMDFTTGDSPTAENPVPRPERPRRSLRSGPTSRNAAEEAQNQS